MHLTIGRYDPCDLSAGHVSGKHVRSFSTPLGNDTCALIAYSDHLISFSELTEPGIDTCYGSDGFELRYMQLLV